ncbi:hypothetical protein FRC12_015591 [Ceratobasidium sp. 428]|nr:hypothetical protein FRC12_015591 [Ceratobasidium sp. 428]
MPGPPSPEARSSSPRPQSSAHDFEPPTTTEARHGLHIVTETTEERTPGLCGHKVDVGDESGKGAGKDEAAPVVITVLTPRVRCACFCRSPQRDESTLIFGGEKRRYHWRYTYSQHVCARLASHQSHRMPNPAGRWAPYPSRPDV